MTAETRAEVLHRIDTIIADCRRIAAAQAARNPVAGLAVRHFSPHPTPPAPPLRVAHLSLDQLQHLRANLDALLLERRTPVPADVVEATVEAVPLRYEANEATPHCHLFKLREAARSLRLQRWPAESIAAGLLDYGVRHHPDDHRVGFVAMAIAEGIADAESGEERVAP